VNALLAQALFAAERSRTDELASQMANGFRGQRVRLDPVAWLPLVVAIVAMIALAWLVARFTAARRRRPGSPWRLFLSLCRAHRLGWSDCWLLWRHARRRTPGDPARLFLDPQAFDAGGLRGLPEKHVSRLAALRGRLFAGLAT
jgi:hypothetical protein